MKIRMWVFLMPVLLILACSATGSETSETFTFDYADTDPAPVVLAIHSGTLNLAPVEGESVSGIVTTNVRAWLVTQDVTEEGAQRVIQGQSRNEVIPNASNQWDVEMGTGHPLALTVNGDAADGNLDLSGVPLRSLAINATSGDYTLDFDVPNPQDDGGRLRIRMGSGDISIAGVFNSHIRDLMSVSVGGNQTFEFGPGTLVQDLEGSIETSVGDIFLRIPTGTAARITFTGASGRVIEQSPDFIEVSDNAFETEEYADSDLPRLQIAVRTSAGDLRLITVPPL